MTLGIASDTDLDAGFAGVNTLAGDLFISQFTCVPAVLAGRGNVSLGADRMHMISPC